MTLCPPLRLCEVFAENDGSVGAKLSDHSVERQPSGGTQRMKECDFKANDNMVTTLHVDRLVCLKIDVVTFDPSWGKSYHCVDFLKIDVDGPDLKS